MNLCEVRGFYPTSRIVVVCRPCKTRTLSTPCFVALTSKKQLSTVFSCSPRNHAPRCFFILFGADRGVHPPRTSARFCWFYPTSRIVAVLSSLQDADSAGSLLCCLHFKKQLLTVFSRSPRNPTLELGFFALESGSPNKAHEERAVGGRSRKSYKTLNSSD